MKKGKLNLDKKSIAKLSEENLDNIIGGVTAPTVMSCCTNVTINDDLTSNDDLTNHPMDVSTPNYFGCSCK
jgi:ABC-type uncharacterized transport system ATPase component